MPYPYQERLAQEGLPELLRAPTGSGKTVAAVLPWLWRRRFHLDEHVRTTTPHWLVVALPLRTLVDQIETEVARWLQNLGLTDDVGLHVLMGGRTNEARGWADTPTRDAILVGSIDMLLSRVLNRGYASSRYSWSIDFGMFNNGAQWVFDEVQLMGPALPTSRQLQGLRDAMGTWLPTNSMWMSATIDPTWLETVDAPCVSSVIEIGEEDRQGGLAERTAATVHIEELLVDPKKAKSIAEAVLAAHVAGTRTICMVNTINQARGVHKQLQRLTDIDIVLVHSRFRPRDRANATDRALAAQVPQDGRIVVTTQAFEAGVDVSSTTLITEAAPWTSIVQRAGRCNRYGEADEARFLWYAPSQPAPYSEEAVAQAIESLRQFEGQDVTSEQLAAGSFELRPHHPVWRRRDMLEVFDTTPTISGEDIDVSGYIRDGSDNDVFVGWRVIGDQAPGDDVALEHEELCRAPLGDVRAWAKKMGAQPSMWRRDPEAGIWRRLQETEVHPGMTVLAASEAGHYTTTLGWDPAATTPVTETDVVVDPLAQASDEAADDDRLSHLGQWVQLSVHLSDTAKRARDLLDDHGETLPEPVREAVVSAAALHDLGKVHPVFQAALRASAGDDEDVPDGLTWAKSSRRKRAPYSRPHFRHELVSAVLLLSDAGRSLLPDEEELTVYLVAAHHGRIRLGMRSLAHDRDPDQLGRTTVLGVVHGEKLASIDVGRVHLPATMLEVEGLTALGGRGSWARLSLPLRDRDDLGVFRLGWLEAVVRLADWIASAQPSEVVDTTSSLKGPA